MQHICIDSDALMIWDGSSWQVCHQLDSGSGRETGGKLGFCLFSFEGGLFLFQVLSRALYVMIGHHGTLLEITHSTTVATVMQSIKGMQMKLLHICPQWTPHHHHHHDKDQGANILARNHFDRMSLPDQWPLSSTHMCTHRAVILYCYTVILYSQGWLILWILLWADAAYSQGWALWAQSQLPQLQNSTHIATYAILHRSFLKCSVKSTFWKHFSALLSVLIKIDCRDCSEETNIIKKAHIVAPG